MAHAENPFEDEDSAAHQIADWQAMMGETPDVTQREVAAYRLFKIFLRTGDFVVGKAAVKIWNLFGWGRSQKKDEAARAQRAVDQGE